MQIGHSLQREGLLKTLRGFAFVHIVIRAWSIEDSIVLMAVVLLAGINFQSATDPRIHPIWLLGFRRVIIPAHTTNLVAVVGVLEELLWSHDLLLLKRWQD